MRPLAALGTLLVAMTMAAPSRADADSDAYVAEVLARNPTLRAGELRRGALAYEAAAAERWPDPSVAVMVDRVPNGMVEMPMVRYQLSQMVMWPGKLSRMRGAIERRGEAVTAETELRRSELQLAARRAYAMLRFNVARREFNRANRNVTATIVNAALGRYGAGLGAHHEVVRAQVEANALDVEFVALEGERDSMVAMLNALRDRPADTTIADPKPEPMTAPRLVLADLTDQALRMRPELRMMSSMQDEMAQMGELARREAYPDFMGSVWFNQMMGAPSTAGFMVGATLPAFGVSRAADRARAFDARAGAIGEERAAMRAMIRYEVTDAVTKLETARQQVTLIETAALPQSRESFKASLASYGAGTNDIVGVLDARRALQTAELARSEARASFEIAVAGVERAVGARPEGVKP